MGEPIKTPTVGGQACEDQIELQHATVTKATGTAADRDAMHRMGKVQEMRRNFRFVSVWAFSMILMSSWETMLGTAAIGLIDGGTAGLIWMYLICWIGFICVNTSMAEMASMAPTAGGQYHWVSEFAPPQSQKFLSYLIGWLCVLGWQTGAANTAFLAGSQIQGLIALNKPDYEFQAWHGTLLVFAVSAFNIVFNTFFVRRLPLIESIVLVVHIFGFFAILVVLWVTGPIADAHTTFTTFNDFGGWNSISLATLSGLVAVVLPLLGADAAVHMSEELQDASKTLPRSMLWTTFVNGSMGFIMLITFCSVLGSIDDALASPTKQAYLYVFYNSTQSVAGATVMGVLVISMAIFCNLSITATSSRQLFAFARDQGVPFSSTFAYVSPKWNVPVNAICLSFAISCLLSLINLGSTAALLNIASLSTAAILASYIVSISCIILKRVRGEPLLPSKFNLGKAGLPINIASIVFLVFVFGFSFMPMGPRPNAAGMNWSILMFGSTVLLSIAYYLFKGKHVYAGPVAYVRKSV
ncbi:amino acid/polyamine transporter I [Boeremia exigua]|uniref:amino acid/polyamine transporter I n=1 Tax=Boeremia exigua TaxID=749465 RepID=UPI001E8E6CC6|nr:amino acid/polyamine transporter I [Boeremia exigua]KAH6625722.1 amino acid/polyamine transporter I [Boeremia exigua]